mmetsp:Transcript_19963/g.39991  ORF Transcript_19963/g.39991 Transcript_19963/m.39991 type:complete len:364 (-) Transcript_19963:115-1206(-)
MAEFDVLLQSNMLADTMPSDDDLMNLLSADDLFAGVPLPTEADIMNTPPQIPQQVSPYDSTGSLQSSPGSESCSPGPENTPMNDVPMFKALAVEALPQPPMATPVAQVSEVSINKRQALEVSVPFAQPCSPEEAAKRERDARLEKNRQAAARCRKKRKAREEALAREAAEAQCLRDQIQAAHQALGEAQQRERDALNSVSQLQIQLQASTAMVDQLQEENRWLKQFIAGKQDHDMSDGLPVVSPAAASPQQHGGSVATSGITMLAVVVTFMVCADSNIMGGTDEWDERPAGRVILGARESWDFTAIAIAIAVPTLVYSWGSLGVGMHRLAGDAMTGVASLFASAIALLLTRPSNKTASLPTVR